MCNFLSWFFKKPGIQQAYQTAYEEYWIKSFVQEPPAKDRLTMNGRVCPVCRSGACSLEFIPVGKPVNYNLNSRSLATNFFFPAPANHLKLKCCTCGYSWRSKAEV